MRKLVLLALNAKYVHSSLPVWLIAAGVSRYTQVEYQTSVVEATIRQSDGEITELVAAFNPHTIGISTYIWNAGKLPGLIAALKRRLPDALIILGGPEASFNEDFWLSRGADAVFRGEAVVDWTDPYTDEYMQTLRGKIAYLETSRGCPGRCGFCLSGGSSLCFLPLETAKERIEKLSRSGARTVKLTDRTFNCDPGRAYELFAFVIGLDGGPPFHFEVNAELFDGRTLDLLQTAPPGRIQFEAGLQSYHRPALEAVNRNADFDKAERNIRKILQSCNIHLHLDLIAGLPYETLSDFTAGFNRAYALGAHTLQLGFLKLLHGSLLREQAQGLGIRYSAEPPYEIVSSPWLSAEDLTVLKHAENALNRTVNKGRFLSVPDYTRKATGLSPFDLFYALGKAAPHHGTALDVYAGELFAVISGFPGIERDKLREIMLRDWTGMVKGEKNIPRFLRG
jgi:hypothetical protein